MPTVETADKGTNRTALRTVNQSRGTQVESGQGALHAVHMSSIRACPWGRSGAITPPRQPLMACDTPTAPGSHTGAGPCLHWIIRPQTSARAPARHSRYLAVFL
ncbi:hypothetical protein GCM10022245_44870 [Streptomyces mayteni]